MISTGIGGLDEIITGLRKGDNAGAKDALGALEGLDPEDQVGGSVIMTLAASLEDDAAAESLTALTTANAI